MADRPIHIETLDPEHARVIRALSGAQRLRLSWDLWDWSRQLVRARLEQAHPDWDGRELDQETARRMLHASR